MSADGRPGRHRAPRRGAKPTLTVVVTSLDERARLDECLSALLPQCARAEAELVVVRSAPASELAQLRRAMPSVRFVHAPSDASLAQLRGLGMSEAGGDIVAFTQDHCVVDGAWVPQLLTGSAGRGAQADSGDSVDWLAYFRDCGVLDGAAAPAEVSTSARATQPT